MPSKLQRLLATPIFKSEEKTRAARFLNAFSLNAIALLIFVILIRLLIQSENGNIPLLILSGLTLILILVQFLMRQGCVRSASIFLVLSAWTAMTFQAWQADGIRDVAAVAYIIIILLASLLLGWRATLALTVMSVSAIWYFAVLEKNGVRSQSADDPLNFARDLTIVFVFAATLIYLLIHNLNRSLQEARLELQERLKAEEKIQRQTNYLTALNQTALGLVNRLELHPLLESILARACELVGTPYGVLDLVLPDGSALKQEIGLGDLNKFNGMLTLKNEGLTGQVWASGKTILVGNYSEWENRNSTLASFGFREVLAVPLKSNEMVIGALVMAHVGEVESFASEQVVVLEQFAALASLAMENARLYEQAQIELKERRLTEFALRASEERFRKIFHASPVAICITSLKDGKLLDANDAYWILRGCTAKSATEQTALEMDFWHNPQERSNFLQNLVERRSLSDPDYKFTTERGENKSTIAFYELIEMEGETVILSMFYDVTAQRQAQEALQESEERFRKVFHANQMAICIATLDEGRFVDANKAFWELSELRPEEALGHTALEMGLWNNLDERKKLVHELQEKRSLQNIEYEFSRKGSDPRETLAFYELIYLKDELCVLAMFYDVTNKKKAEQALQQSEARTHALLDAIPDMIFEISHRGVFLNFIPSSEFEPAMPPEEFLGKHIAEVFPPSISAPTIFALDRALQSGQLHAFEYGLPPGEETHFFEARITPIDEETVLLMVRDITQRKWVETEREKLIKELEDKNAELERFTYTVSHDLKSPLITIKGFLGFLEKDALSEDTTRLKADIKRIADATDKMQQLLNELLKLSRIGRLTNPPQKVPFEELAREAVEIAQGRIQARNIQIQIQNEMAIVYGDRQRLVEALQNLVDNAAKFMGAQPEPCIEIGQRGEEHGGLVFFVRDNGVGIAPEHHDRIFGLFNKLDADSDGTGIGLALVKRIIEVHGGRIWVESEAGNGSTFCFTLRDEPVT